MKKFQKVFNAVSVVIAVFAIIFVMSFVSERINEFRTRQNVIKSNVNYVIPDKDEPKRYEQIQTEKPLVNAMSSVKENKKAEEKKDAVIEDNTPDLSRFAADIVRNYSEKLTYNEKTKDYRSHNGIDIRTEEPVTAIYNGTVQIEKNTKESTVDILLKSINGEAAIYKGIELAEGLSDGAEVKVNEILGYASSNNGFIFHFGVIKNEKFINPTEIFK